MQDVDMRELFHQYVTTDEPPMRATSADMLLAGRRSRRSRILAAAAALGVAIAAGAAILPMVLTEEGGNGYAEPPPVTFAPLQPCTERPGSRPEGSAAVGKPLPVDLKTWAERTVTCYLSDRLPVLLPTAEYAQIPNGPGLAMQAVGRDGTPGGPESRSAEDARNKPDIPPSIHAYALMRDSHGTGDISVSVSLVGAGDTAEMAIDVCEDTRNCTHHVSGDSTIIVTAGPADPTNGFQSAVVSVYRGHTVVSIDVSNSDRAVTERIRDSAQPGSTGSPASSIPAGPRGTRTGLPLTSEQLLELAMAPQLYLFP